MTTSVGDDCDSSGYAPVFYLRQWFAPWRDNSTLATQVAFAYAWTVPHPDLLHGVRLSHNTFDIVVSCGMDSVRVTARIE